MAETYDLDLDLLQPQSKTVKLNGKFYIVNPPKLKDIANLARLAGQLRDAKENGPELIERMINAFGNVMPDLKNDPEVDLSINQLMKLFEFVTAMVNPDENSALKAAGIEPTTEKKIPPA